MEVLVGILSGCITLLACTITYLAWRNGRIIRENTDKIVKASSENTDKIIKVGNENTEKILKVISETTDKTLKAIVSVKEITKLIALLILAETPEEKKELAKKILET